MATVLIAVYVFGGCVLIVRLMYLQERRYAESDRTFNDRFPPISDEEFVARCRPGTRPEIALKVRRTIADCLGVEYERIYPESQLRQDLGADR
jgi:hypothetical protein